MKASELMLNDWVQHEGTPYRVRLIADMGVVTADDGICHFHFISKYLDPIPLTEEILVKNGFDCQYYDDGNSYWWAVFDGWFNINFDHSDCSEGEFRCVNFRDLVIKSVHQLQHLLRLCGIEKEIELVPPRKED